MPLNLKKYLSKVQMGEMQQCGNMAVVPLFYEDSGKADYLTLKEAMRKKAVAVNEVSPGAKIVELVADVQDNLNVFLLDGEELSGGRANRILNASILLSGKSRTAIPVSSAEQGRWHLSRSKSFSVSDNLASYLIRTALNRSISNSLKAERRYNSDQYAVWSGISDLQAKAKIRSDTHAMRDIFDASKKDMERYLRAFARRPGQKGMLVFINGEVAGFDIISRESAFSACRGKLVSSYCLDAMYFKKQRRPVPDLIRAKNFLDRISSCKSAKYKSVGSGSDYRFEGKDFTGAALEVDGEVLHMTFLRAA